MNTPKTRKILDIIYQETEVGTKIFIKYIDMSTNIIDTYQYHYGMFLQLSKLPKIGEIYEYI